MGKAEKASAKAAKAAQAQFEAAKVEAAAQEKKARKIEAETATLTQEAQDKLDTAKRNADIKVEMAKSKAHDIQIEGKQEARQEAQRIKDKAADEAAAIRKGCRRCS